MKKTDFFQENFLEQFNFLPNCPKGRKVISRPSDGGIIGRLCWCVGSSIIYYYTNFRDIKDID